MTENQPLQEAGLLLSRCRIGQSDLERLDHLAVLNSGRTGGLAGPAIETELEVLANPGAHRQPAVGDRAHQVNPPAGLSFSSHVSI